MPVKSAVTTGQFKYGLSPGESAVSVIS